MRDIVLNQTAFPHLVSEIPEQIFPKFVISIFSHTNYRQYKQSLVKIPSFLYFFLLGHQIKLWLRIMSVCV